MTKYDILIAMDRVHTITVMLDELIGGIGWDENVPIDKQLDDVYEPVRPHWEHLAKAESELADLYQKLGTDLYYSETDKEPECAK